MLLSLNGFQSEVFRFLVLGLTVCLSGAVAIAQEGISLQNESLEVAETTAFEQTIEFQGSSAILASEGNLTFSNHLEGFDGEDACEVLIAAENGDLVFTENSNIQIAGSLILRASGDIMLRANIAVSGTLEIHAGGVVDIFGVIISAHSVIIWDGTAGEIDPPPPIVIGTPVLEARAQPGTMTIQHVGPEIHLGIDARAGLHYTLQCSTTLREEDWQDVEERAITEAGPLTFRRTRSADQPHFFYRIKVESGVE